MNGLLRFLHVLAVVALLGNMLTAPFWRKRLAIAGGQARAAANRSVRTMDMMFTLPGWVVVLISGIWLAFQRGWKGGWIHLSLLLFIGWVVLWHMKVLRARQAMITQADAAASAGEANAELAHQESQWQLWTYISIALLGLILLLMTIKPF